MTTFTDIIKQLVTANYDNNQIKEDLKRRGYTKDNHFVNSVITRVRKQLGRPQPKKTIVIVTEPRTEPETRKETTKTTEPEPAPEPDPETTDPVDPDPTTTKYPDYIQLLIPGDNGYIDTKNHSKEILS